MYADDIVLLSMSANGLQKSIDVFKQYTYRWGLEINPKKTKIMVFNKRRTDSLAFWYGKNKIDIVDSYTYLGIQITPSGKFTSAEKLLYTKANKAYFSISQSLNSHNGTSVNTLCTLFDTNIKPILLYGSDVWGAYKFNKVSTIAEVFNSKNILAETMHLKVCKHILGVHSKSSNKAVVAELGRYPLVISIIVAALKYFLRLLIQPKGSLLHDALKEQSRLSELGKNSIFSLVKLLNKEQELQGQSNECDTSTKKKITNLYTLWNDLKKTKISKLSIFRIKQLGRTCKEALLCKYKSHLLESFDFNLSKLSIYKSVKNNFRKEPYLLWIKSPKLRFAITRLRISAPQLPVETGRYSNIQKTHRICKLCNSGEIGDELHLVIKCKYQNIDRERNVMFNNVNKTTPQFQSLSDKNKFVYLLSCTYHDITKMFSTFCYRSLEIANSQ